LISGKGDIFGPEEAKGFMASSVLEMVEQPLRPAIANPAATSHGR
jgi:hypothetical protein